MFNSDFGNDTEQKQNKNTKSGMQGLDQKNKKLVPLMIKMVNIAFENMNESESGEKLVIDECECDQIQVVGRITELLNQPGKTLISIDDTTGEMTVQVNKRYDQTETKILIDIDLDTDKFLKATCQIQKYKEQIIAVVLKLENITDMDAITEHNLKALLCEKHRKFGPLREEETENTAPTVTNNYQPGNKEEGSLNINQSDENLSLQDQILNCFKRDMNGRMTLEKISLRLNSSNVNQVEQTIAILLDNGEIIEEDSGIFTLA